jgi:hypothetical protein
MASNRGRGAPTEKPVADPRWLRPHAKDELARDLAGIGNLTQ